MVKRLIVRTLKRFGYRLDRVDRLPDLRDKIEDPREASYNFNIYPHFLMNVPVSRGRGKGAYPLSPDGFHPFVVAIRTAVGSDDPLETIKSVLSQYAEQVKPENTLAGFGLDADDAPGLSGMTAIVPWLYPWAKQVKDIAQYIEIVTADLEDDYSDYRLHQTLSEAGYVGYSATSPEMIEVEALRLYRLFVAITRESYKRHSRKDGDIYASILINSDEWRWIVSSGQHRAAILSGLDKAYIPVRVKRVVRPEDVDVWPNVRSGFFTREGALKVFDRLFNGTPRPVDEKWIQSNS